MKNYHKLELIFKRIRNINNANSILNWDTAVMMPKGSINARAEQIATLESIVHDLMTSQEVKELIAKVDTKELDDWQKANFEHMIRIRKHTIAVPNDLMQAFSKACNETEMVWRDARKNDDFKIFQPYFENILKLTREVAKAKGESLGCSPYEALVDWYDPGTKTSEIDAVFDNLAQFLPKFIDRVINHQASKLPKIAADALHLAADKQNNLGLTCMRALGFNFNKGRLDVSVHPFCGGLPDDIRITTRYDEKNFISSLMGVVHETGHALYEQNLPHKWIDQPVGAALGMATHESQSLSIEMQVCRSKEFLQYILPLVIKEKGNNHPDLTVENLYKFLNTVKPSLIRVDADEVTYPAHVIMRYRLEKAMISSELEVKDLPDAWNEEIFKLLGVKPNNYKDGCLQDIHWPSGGFGYFPSYSLGAIMAAQWVGALRKDLHNMKGEVAKGNFKDVVHWLNKNIHNNGSRYSRNELLIKATGKPLDVEGYKEYLEDKFINSFD
jgi:carboxypeptidase Taq